MESNLHGVTKRGNTPEHISSSISNPTTTTTATMRAPLSSGVEDQSTGSSKLSMGSTARGNRRAAASVSNLFFVYATLAGACGALSGVVGKVAVSPTAVNTMVQFFSGKASEAVASSSSSSSSSGVAAGLLLILRVVFFASNAFFTGQMWRYYIKSLSLGPTPVCQIINTGTNFAVSALMGIVFFGETVNVMWAVGAFFVVIGLALVVVSTKVAS